ncbi:MAG TPA: extracellular solute-binding protein [Nocardioidaceae bacterium]|nr:extracellular solute-binding protein [Nocardioidaceae bacterium]
MPVSRRQFLSGAGSLATAAVLSGCAGFTKSESSQPSASKAGTVRFTTWGSDAEAAAFKQLATKFEAANKGATVDLKIVPYGEMFTGIDAQLQSGTAPDVFRVDYTTMGVYSSKGVLLDLTSSLDSSLKDDLIPALLQAVSFEDKVFGVPQQTDTTAVLYRPELLEAAGVTDLPGELDAAWTWEEFGAVADRLKASLDPKISPFVYDWQELGAFRWLTWLFEAGGRLLEEDLTTPALVSPQGRKALEFTTSFFEKGWVPKNTSVKGATYPDAAFISGQVAMAFAGNFLLPGIADGIKNKFDWQVTYQPRDVRASSDLGGNALVATKDSKSADLAAEFLTFMVAPENMRLFCEKSLELPTRQSLVSEKLDFAVRPDLMPVYVDQSTSLTADDVAQVTVPYFGQVNTLLQDQLELAFRGRQGVDETLQNIADGITAAAS